MSFRLPTADHPAREAMGDVASVAVTLDPANVSKLPVTWQACRSARDAFEADKAGAMKRINFIVLRADSDERWLISVGRRGGWKKLWNFGNGRSGT